MCKLCTPLLALAAGGLIQGLGLQANPLVAGAVTGLLSGGGVAGALQGAFSAGVGVVAGQIGQSISQIPGFITGVANPNFVGPLPPGVNINNSNFFGSIVQQGQNLISQGARGLTETFQAAAGYIDNAFNLSGSIESIKGYNINENELGFTVKSWSDMLSGGVASQFPGIPGEGWTTEQWSALQGTGSTGDAFNGLVKGLQTNLGSFYGSVSDLSTSFNPASIVQNLVNQGLGTDIITHLEKYGISYESLMSGNVDPARLTKVMDDLPGKKFTDIVVATGLTAATGFAVSKFSEALNTRNVLGATVAAGIGIPLMSDLGNKLFNLSGYNHTFSNFGDVGATLEQLRSAPTTAINALTPAAFTAFATAALANVGSGSGTFANPKMTDMVGVLTGNGYLPKLDTIQTLNTRIMNTAEGQALYNAVVAAQSAVGNPTQEAAAAAAITAAAAPFVNPTNSQLAADIAVGNTAFNTMYQKLKNEKLNLKLAEIADPITGNVNLKGSVSSIISFATGLHQVHNDDSNLGIAAIINEATANDVTGEAIRAGIVEGRNLAILQARGLNLDTRSDPVALSQSRLQST